MKNNEVLDKVLRSFQHYYDIKTEGVSSPFSAEAVFHAHTEQYFLVKAAKLSDIDSNEYVFFALTDTLTEENLLHFDDCAWKEGLSRVKPAPGHRNSDISLVILADAIDESALKKIKKLRHYKSYKFSFYGWSNYRLFAYDLSRGKGASNRLGKDLKRYISSI